MSNAKDFVIENGILKKYKGSGGNVVVPEGVTRIGDRAFSGCENLQSITLPEGVTSIGDWAFYNCKSLQSITLPEGVTSIGNGAFEDCEKLQSVTIPDSVTSIGSRAFEVCTNLTSVVIPKSVKNIGSSVFSYSGLKDIELCGNQEIAMKNTLKDCPYLQSVFAPEKVLSQLIADGLGMFAARAFINRYREYSDPSIVSEYVSYISSQRKKLLPEVFVADAVDIIKMLAEAKKITKKNMEQDYLMPAKQFKAEKCFAYLEGIAESSLAGKKDVKPASFVGHELWDGVHFSIDGKQLIKYKEEPGRTEYHVPEGTKTICAGAFMGDDWVKNSRSCSSGTSLERIYLPESVTAIRRGAFCANLKGTQTLFVALPNGLKSIPPAAFIAGDGITNIILTSNQSIANILCEDRRAYCIYTGGPLDDLSPRAKPYAVRGFLYVEQNGVADMSPWREGYLEHIRRNEKTYIKQAEEDEFLLRLMVNEKLLSEKGTKTLLGVFEKQNRAELTATLLNYQSAQFGGGMKDDLTLSDDDPEIKRMLKMQARREQIKDQKGIAGLTFVATGDFKKFGYVEYTGARDLSDLKEYIEERGGYLRSAVSSKTDYLICNDSNSNTTKSKKAKELGVTVITEKEFLKMTEGTK